MGADIEASWQQFVHQFLDVGLDEIEVCDHGWRVEGIDPIADFGGIHVEFEVAGLNEVQC